MLPSVAMSLGMAAALALGSWTTGCALIGHGESKGASRPLPSNVFRESEHLSPDLKRVALLPLTIAREDSSFAFGREALEPIVAVELGRTKRFEVVQVTPEQLKRWTGRSHWADDDILPADFFSDLQRKLGCDAVLFCRLTEFRPYDTPVVGWHMALVDSRTPPHKLWAVEEIFDASDPVVAAAYRHYLGEAPPSRFLGSSENSIHVISARRFAQYTANAVLETLPAR